MTERRTRSRSRARRVWSVTTPARSRRSTPRPDTHGGRCSTRRAGSRRASIRVRCGRGHVAPVRLARGAGARPRHRRAALGGAHGSVHRRPHGPSRACGARDRRRRPHALVEARDLATGELQWQTPVPASFEEAIEPAVDDHAVAVVDHFGVVSLLDPVTGRLRCSATSPTCSSPPGSPSPGHRVAFTSYAGVLHVLDRRDGHVVQQLAPARLGGLPVPPGSQRGSGASSWPSACESGASSSGAWSEWSERARRRAGPLPGRVRRAARYTRRRPGSPGSPGPGITHARTPRSSGATSGAGGRRNNRGADARCGRTRRGRAAA